MKNLFAIAGHFVLVHWPMECSVSVVPDVKVDPCPASKGDECAVQVEEKRYKGKVLDVGELVVLHCVGKVMCLLCKKNTQYHVRAVCHY